MNAPKRPRRWPTATAATILTALAICLGTATPSTAAPSVGQSQVGTAAAAEPADGLSPDRTDQPTLRTGSSGEAVRHLQQLLTAHGHPTTVDGVFGPHTEAAVKAFQQDKKLAVDGIVGPDTWGQLLAAPASPEPQLPESEAPEEPAEPAVPDAPDNCWIDADTSANFAYRCEFGLIYVHGPNATKLKDAVFIHAINDFGDTFPFGGCGQSLQEDEVCYLQPGNAPIKVVSIGGDSFTFQSLRGHPEGPDRYITFSFQVAGNQLRLGVHSRGKPSFVARMTVQSGGAEALWGTYAKRRLLG